MKSELKSKLNSVDITYPCLMHNKHNDFIVLFINAEWGTVVWVNEEDKINCAYKVGHFHQWIPCTDNKEWELSAHTIELSN